MSEFGNKSRWGLALGLVCFAAGSWVALSRPEDAQSVPRAGAEAVQAEAQAEDAAAGKSRVEPRAGGVLGREATTKRVTAQGQVVVPDAGVGEGLAARKSGRRPLHFRTTADGALEIAPDTRDEVERLVALHGRDDLGAQLRAQQEALPPEAGQRLGELVEQYMSYAAALRAAIPPGSAPAGEQALLAQLEDTHRIRVEHFGQAAAEAMFGEEEDMSRTLLRVAAIRRDGTLSDEQRSQQLEDVMRSNPHLASMGLLDAHSVP